MSVASRSDFAPQSKGSSQGSSKGASMALKKPLPLMISIPHSGERVPEETPWLNGLPEPVLMRDVDRYVDQLYQPVIDKLGLHAVKTEWHRYAVDLNRWADDVDASSVEGHVNQIGKFPRGLHWSITTLGEKLMPNPMSVEVHQRLISRYFMPFHDEIRKNMAMLRETGVAQIFHLDVHSMPSLGTNEHRDPGERRADVVISDCDGKSSSKLFCDLVIGAYQNAGFRVSYNWPYKGGRVTETYGRPGDGVHSIQIELNRALYMNEENKKLNLELSSRVQQQIAQAVEEIYLALPHLNLL
jgi:N-formylglutamate amidohydrolase